MFRRILGLGCAALMFVACSQDHHPTLVDVVPLFSKPGGPVHSSATGNWYEVVAAPGLSWANAEAAAAARTHHGVPGHLVTVTCQAETDLLVTILPDGPFWMGGRQPAGSPEPAGGWTWITGEAFGPYTNWRPGEPNNNPNPENVLYMQGGGPNSGTWVDYGAHRTDIDGYVVEYEHKGRGRKGHNKGC